MNTHTFIRRVNLPVSAHEAYAWHERPGAFERLIPPWENVRVVSSPSGGIRNGDRVELQTSVGPVPMRWIIEHRDCIAGVQFRDVVLHGPFSYWSHLHRFEPQEENRCRLEDSLEYVLPCGALGNGLGAGYVERQLERLFRYRHATISEDLNQHDRYRDRPHWKIAVTGASGLIGSALLPYLTTGGHEVFSWRRQNADSYYYQKLDFPAEAVVHLAGENLAGRWTAQKKAKIYESRVEGTQALCRSLAEMSTPPKVLICASAVGYFGSRGDEILEEQSAAGSGFLAELTSRWESATEPAKQRGIRVVLLRFGMILSPRGGALKSMLPPFQLGIGGRMGSGRQYWSWISIDDAVSAILHALQTESLEGPVLAVSPGTVTNAEFATGLGRVLHRPTLTALPTVAVRTLLGELGEELLLASKRAVPTKLLETGFQFRHPRLEEALGHLLGR